MLALLHTSPVHVQPFEALFHEVAPDILLRQVVREDLLATALACGHGDAVTRLAIEELASAGARVVLCTCSTIGGAAEAAGSSACVVIRVDRPAIEHAVATGRRIVIVAALETALTQTLRLLDEVRLREHKSPAVVPLLCASAWPLFESGKQEQYLGALAAEIDASAHDDDLVLLAQASMSDARRYVRRELEILGTPRLAVQAAVAAYRDAKR